ncbi:LysR family transcriptional regulator [Streptomyces poonensis]|uniref:LysR family transcriptional regulator n=1 Tax=Streptomyces poonensis TaxID=68255 RepID=A0A918PWF2_9ACTN|nr:LysR family transcriptional regulator [Streptomyces poonensis]GGZ25626.1 LysR family transcriptional regulator [Streptomyces poonensis]GLJ89103.1 LysR family transcriptional regulator [Streptomyces poonensis]
MVLDIRKLVLLREVQARGSIAAAAEALNYTRSAVSQQLSALEAETGAQLLDRRHKRAGLTAAGRLLVEHTEHILVGLETAESDLLAATGRVCGELRVGMPFHEGPALLVPALTRVRQAHPDLRITLEGMAAGSCREAVRLGQVDLALAVRYDGVPEPLTPGLYEELVAADRIRLAIAPEQGPGGDRGHGTPPDRLTDYADRSWVLDSDSGLGRLTLHACAGAGFVPDVVARTSDLQATLGLVSLGWGVSLVPDLAPDRPGFPVRRVALDGPALVRHVSLVVRRGALSSPAVAVILSEVRRQSGDSLRAR